MPLTKGKDPLKVEDVMTRDARCVAPSDSLDHAARLLWEADCGFLPVCDEDGRLVGVLTDRDVCMTAHFRGADLKALRAEDAMSREVETCEASDAVEAALERMGARRVRRLPVVDGGRRVVGVVAAADALLAAKRKGGPRAKLLVDTLAAISQPRATARA